MARDLTRIGERARQEQEARFTSIYHYVTDLDHLRACYAELPADRAVGIDEVGKKEYGQNLESKLEDLSARLQRMGYRPQAARRAYIQKPGTNKQRPLGILCFEDKLVGLGLCAGADIRSGFCRKFVRLSTRTHAASSTGQAWPHHPAATCELHRRGGH